MIVSTTMTTYQLYQVSKDIYNNYNIKVAMKTIQMKYIRKIGMIVEPYIKLASNSIYA